MEDPLSETSTRPAWGTALLLLLILAAAACAPRLAEPADQASPEPLLSSLQAYTSGDGVTLVLQVTNTSSSPVELEFSTGQSYDFVVSRDEREFWRWSADRAFTQALRSEVVSPGETLRYQEVWPNPAELRGEFTVTGTLTARNYPLTQTATLDLE